MKQNIAVDAVLCISIKDKEHRRQLLLEQFSCFTNEIEFLLVDKDQENPERGCYHSHQACAQIALDRGYNNVLILEDDATFIPPTIRQMNQINNFIEQQEFELFFLGGIPKKFWFTPHRGIAKCDIICAQAYIVNPSSCQKIVSHPYQGTPIDEYYRDDFMMHCCFPLISFQQPIELVGSDINAALKKRGTTEGRTWDKYQAKQYKLAKKGLNIFRYLYWSLLDKLGK